MTLDEWESLLSCRLYAFDFRFGVHSDDDGISVSPDEVMKILMEPVRPDLQVYVFPQTANPDPHPVAYFPSLAGMAMSRYASDASKMRDIANEFSYLADVLERGDSPMDESKVSTIFQEYDAITNSENRRYQEIFIAIDASAESKTIAAAIPALLESVRLDVLDGGKKIRWTDADVKSWIDSRVLQYIDLALYAYRIAKGTCTHAVMGQLLYPSEIDVDVTERVRKVTKPMAAVLLDEEFLTALRMWLDHSNRNKNP